MTVSDEGYMEAVKIYFMAQSEQLPRKKKITKPPLTHIQSPSVTIIIRQQTIHLAQDVALLGTLTELLQNSGK